MPFFARIQWASSTQHGGILETFDPAALGKPSGSLIDLLVSSPVSWLESQRKSVGDEATYSQTAPGA